ncbi:hypothetical protein GCM10025734_14740 [Kitasatospora paranensis]|uniref:hypothetical protein n=1 Tax=Kitasatospora paranensis TaxID=258053 RepID=UPI0031F0701D
MLRRGRGRKLSVRILTGQLAILAVTSVIGFVLLAQAQRAQLDREYEQRALAIAETTAADPQIRNAMEYGGGGDVVQAIAGRIEAASGASYVVVIDLQGIRHSHPHPELIGRAVEEPLAVLGDRTWVGINHGATGSSANGKAPCTARPASWSARCRSASPRRTSSDSCAVNCPPSVSTWAAPWRSAPPRPTCSPAA